jgi:hypothetical protein
MGKVEAKNLPRPSGHERNEEDGYLALEAREKSPVKRNGQCLTWISG